MASDVGIANTALVRVGANKIISFDQGTPSANFMDRRFAEARIQLLRLHPWNFATRRAQLARESTAPAFKWSYYFTLPSNWVRTINVFDNDAGAGEVDYREEDNRIACNSEQVYLEYVYHVTDPNTMTPDFRATFEWYLAMDAAPDLANSLGLFDRMEAGFESALMNAKSTDALSNRGRKMARGSWVTSRNRSQARWPG